MPKKFDAVLFDIDGTLLDTKELIFQAFYHTLLKCNISMTREQAFSFPGMKLAEYYKFFAPDFDTEELSAEHRKFQDKNLHLTKIFPNVSETLDQLFKAGFKKAAVTNRGGGSVTPTLELTNILHYFSAIVTVDDVVNPKPHPEPIVKALALLNVKPHRAIMIGDTEVDIIAGREAGVQTIGVSYGFHGRRIAESKPDFIVRDIKDILSIILAVRYTSVVYKNG